MPSVLSRPIISVAALNVACGSLMAALHVQAVLSDEALATTLISPVLWRSLVRTIGELHVRRADVHLLPLLLLVGAVSLAAWCLGAWIISRRRRLRFRDALARWGTIGWLWSALPFVWSLAEMFTGGSIGVSQILNITLPLWWSVAIAGWITTFAAMANGWRFGSPAVVAAATGECRRVPVVVWSGILAYLAVFGILTTLLWISLRIPHGDSAMYEEHLWNLLHGKGFRSYLDDGRLFLGEHIQVVHVLLVPLYVLWPSHLLLEYCQSAALAAGAVPVFRIAQRHSESRAVGAMAACAYLLYFPMQYLDTSVDFKTFRPNAFEIPFLLFALDALERRRLVAFIVWLVLTLSCQEDAAMILAPLGVWIAVRSRAVRNAGDHTLQPSAFSLQPHWTWLGLSLAALGVVYLVLVIKVVLPSFRGGADVHFANYFSDLGGSTGEIVQNLFRDPGRFVARLCTAESLLFGLALLVPLGGLPLLSSGRLAVAAPLFGVLCLSDVTNDPRHHFHAPLVPIVVWAAAAGLGNVAPAWNVLLRWRHARSGRKDPFRKWIAFRVRPTPRTLKAAAFNVAATRVPVVTLAAGVWLLACAMVTGGFFGSTPASLGFWDPGSHGNWRIYLPDRRAENFPRAFALVPLDARVASTDFVHPRFTHHARSYDYSGYRPKLPADTEYLVIDTLHPYSIIRSPEQVPEYRDRPADWELLLKSEFLVLRRRNVRRGDAP